jgi:hypothetical protein
MESEDKDHKKRVVIGAVVSAIIAVALFSVGSLFDAASQSPPPVIITGAPPMDANRYNVSKPQGAEPPILVDDLAYEYAANEVKANDTYKGRTLTVLGRVGEIQSGEHSEQINVQGSDNAEAVCLFDYASESQVARLVKGDSITITGMCAGSSAHTPQLEQCTVVSSHSIQGVSDEQIAAIKLPISQAALIQRLGLPSRVGEMVGKSFTYHIGTDLTYDAEHDAEFYIDRKTSTVYSLNVTKPDGSVLREDHVAGPWDKS